MSKFTPGPWFANGRYIGTAKHMSAIGECRDVNGNWCDDVKASANASLIAAAPELLEALQDALCALECCGKVSPVATKASAAIAKATGEAP